MAAIPLKMDSHPARVLVVDDDDSYCTIIRELLVRYGYEVRVAYSVEEALTSLQDERPDLILTDLMMPEVDGITFIRHLRATPPHSGIPTIVVSALVLARERAAAAQAGADAFVAKPFSIQQLQATIHEVVGE
jgi:two-component system cell cycle response regulator DivK